MTSLPDNGALTGPLRDQSPVDATRAQGAPAREVEEGGPAFRALLADLQAKAAELKASSEKVAGPNELRGAVDTARATLENALDLGDQVLEAFRGARHAAESKGAQGKSIDETEQGSSGTDSGAAERRTNGPEQA